MTNRHYKFILKCLPFDIEREKNILQLVNWLFVFNGMSATSNWLDAVHMIYKTTLCCTEISTGFPHLSADTLLKPFKSVN